MDCYRAFGSWSVAPPARWSVGKVAALATGIVERKIEAHAVSEFLAYAEESPAGLVIEGEAGIGKTTLVLDAIDRAAERGFRVLSARGAPAEVTYAYAALADLLSGVDIGQVTSLPELQRTALERARSGVASGGGPATDERLVATALLSVLGHFSATAPVLVAIDDAQWLDASSRAVIAYTARRLRGRAGIVASFRVEEQISTDSRLWLDLPRPEMTKRMRMTPLSLGGVHALIVARLGRTLPRPTVVRIYEISGGNPLFALELAASAAVDTSLSLAELPDSLAMQVRRRIGDVDGDVATVLLAAACAATPTVELVGSVTEQPASRVVELLESVESLNIVAIEGNRVRFTHPLFASGVYADAAASLRRAMHRKLAAQAEQPEVKARHLALAATTGDSATLSALDAAAEATSSQGAPAAAAELIELALGLGGHSPERLVRAGELCFRAGSFVAAREHLQSALADAPPGMVRCLALMWLGAVKAYDDDMAGAVEAMKEAADEAGEIAPLRLLCLLRLGLALAMADRWGEAIDCGELAVELADQVGVPGLRSQALSVLAVGKFVWGLGVDRAALATAVELEDPYGGATTYFQARAAEAVISAYSGDLERAATQMRAVQQRMQDHGTEVDLMWAANRVAAIAVWSGRYADAAEAARDAVQRCEQMGGRLSLATAWTTQAIVAAYVGRESEAREKASIAIDTAHQIGARELLKAPTAILGFLEVSLGNYTAALTVLQPLLEAFHPTHGVEIEGGAYLPDAIEALTATGRIDDAEPLVDALECAGTARDRPWMLAIGARGRGHLLAARGDLEAAERAVQQALIHHERLPMPFETARTQLLLGQLQRRRRHKQAASATLVQALDVFDSIGAPLWARRARAELTRLAATPVPGIGLTPAEERIARRAAAGLSNKEIAAELFLAPKTIEMNLSSVYRKLGIRSRAQLHSRLGAAEDQGKP